MMQASPYSSGFNRRIHHTRAPPGSFRTAVVCVWRFVCKGGVFPFAGIVASPCIIDARVCLLRFQVVSCPSPWSFHMRYTSI